MTDPDRFIHYTDPFAAPREERNPVRRLRGRIASGVTVWTSGGPSSRAGLTVSSVMVAEGSPSPVFGLINDTTALWDAVQETGAFVVHVLSARDRVLADRFAGMRPSPGGLFADLDVEDSPWGPVVRSFPERAYCRYVNASPAGYQLLVQGDVERIELGDLTEPLVHFRGRYRALRPDRSPE